MFRHKSLDYGPPPMDLGARGQYADMHRKMRKLKRALWDGDEMVGEQPYEIVQDLIGHCLITLMFLQHGSEETA